jgi:hypothetical protein
MHPGGDEFTVIEGGKSQKDGNKENTFSATAVRTAGGLLITLHDRPGIGILWPHLLGVMPCGGDTLTIIASFCLVTLSGPRVATLARMILDRRISELREGIEIEGARIEKIMIEGNLPSRPLKPSSVPD